MASFVLPSRAKAKPRLKWTSSSSGLIFIAARYFWMAPAASPRATNSFPSFISVSTSLVAPAALVAGMTAGGMGTEAIPGFVATGAAEFGAFGTEGFVVPCHGFQAIKTAASAAATRRTPSTAEGLRDDFPSRFPDDLARG